MTGALRSSRRSFLKATGAAGAIAPALLPGLTRASARQQPNIVLITADDLGYGDLTGYGRADFETRVLDSLAAQGTRFTQCYSIAAICTPTRVGMMTGRYPARHPIGLLEPLTLSPGHRALGLEPSRSNLPAILKGAGYTNGLIGKWHLGALPPFHPLLHGFDHFFGPLGGAVDYVAHVDPSGDHDLFRNRDPVHVSGYLTDIIAEEAVRFVRSAPEPFFLNHQGTAPHSPWQRRGDAPADRSLPLAEIGFDVGPDDRFADMVAALDEAVGRILAALDERGIAERTLVIFTSDNGGKQHSSMGGLAGGKGTLWEGGIRVPTFVRWPNVIPAGVTTRQVATTLDWTATILAAAGAQPPPLDGIDLLPILSGAAVRERTIFWRMRRTRQLAMRRGSHKYLLDGDSEYLFDLGRDPGERSNLKDADAAILREMREETARWNREMLPLA